MSSSNAFIAYLKKIYADYNTFKQFHKVQSRNPTVTFEEDVQILNRKALVLGKRVYISKGVVLHCGGGYWSNFGGKITIGDHVYIGSYALLQGAGEIEIGKNCQIGPNCMIFSLGPSIKKILLDRSVLDQDMIPHDFKKVTIEENAIVGAGTVILPGVTIGHGSLIWPGSFIHKDVAPETYIVTKLSSKNFKARAGLFRG